MTDRARDLLTRALALGPDERAALADELLASLDGYDPPQDVERAWGEEIARRVRRVMEGEPATDLDVALARIRNQNPRA